MSSSKNIVTLNAASDEVKAYSSCRPVEQPKTNLRAQRALAQCDGERVRVHIAGRKMPVPGRVHGLTLHTNWGLELDLSSQDVVAVDLKDYDRNRWERAYDFVAA